MSNGLQKTHEDLATALGAVAQMLQMEPKRMLPDRVLESSLLFGHEMIKYAEALKAETLAAMDETIAVLETKNLESLASTGKKDGVAEWLLGRLHAMRNENGCDTEREK